MSRQRDYPTTEVAGLLSQCSSFGITDSHTRTKRPKNELFYKEWQQKNSGLVQQGCSWRSAPLIDCLVAAIKIDPPTREARSFTFIDAKDLFVDCVVRTFCPEGVEGAPFRLWAAVQVVHQVGSQATGWLEGVQATAKDNFGRYLRLKENLTQCQFLNNTSPTEDGVILFAYLAVKVPVKLLHLLFGKDEKSSEHYLIDEDDHGILPLWGPTLKTEPSDNTTSLEVSAPDEAQLKRRLQAVHSLFALWHNYQEEVQPKPAALGALHAELESVQQLFYLMNRAPSPKALNKAIGENTKNVEAYNTMSQMLTDAQRKLLILTDVQRSLEKKRRLLELHSVQSVKLHQEWFGKKAVQHQGETGKKPPTGGWDLGIVAVCTTNNSDMWCADAQEVPLQWNYDYRQECVQPLDDQLKSDEERMKGAEGIRMKCCCQLCSSTGENTTGVSLYWTSRRQADVSGSIPSSVFGSQDSPTK
jgi:hypothetical protein